jgi:transposase
MRLDGATDGEHFRAYVEQILVFELTPGDVVVVDNLSTHKVADVRAAIEAAGAHLLYLPPYSLDFKPIEIAFSKFKALIRAVNPRTLNELCHASCNAGRRSGFPSRRGKSGWIYFGSFLVPRRPRTTIGQR